MGAAAAVPLCAFSKSHGQNELLAATREVSTCLFIWEMKLKPQLISKSRGFGKKKKKKKVSRANMQAAIKILMTLVSSGAAANICRRFGLHSWIPAESVPYQSTS
jgi:hypothetical protein